MFHSGMTEANLSAVSNDFTSLNSTIRIVLCSSAFSMGKVIYFEQRGSYTNLLASTFSLAASASLNAGEYFSLI